MKKESSGVQTVKYTRVYEQIRASKGRREELLLKGSICLFPKGFRIDSCRRIKKHLLIQYYSGGVGYGIVLYTT